VSVLVLLVLSVVAIAAGGEALYLYLASHSTAAAFCAAMLIIDLAAGYLTWMPGTEETERGNHG